MRFPLLVRALFLLLFSLSAHADWIQTRQVNEVAYFLQSDPARVDRFDLASRQWLTPVNLPVVRGAATAGYFDPQGIYVAYSRAVYRYDLQGGNETFVLNAGTNVIGLITNSTHLFVHHPGTADMTSVSKATNTIVESKDFWYTMTGMSIAPDGSAIFGRSTSVSPSDIVRIPVNANGTMGNQTDSPHHGSYAAGSQTWVFPDGGRVIDSSGTAYRTGDLQYAISLGSAINDLQFRGTDVPIVLRNSELIAFTNTLLPAGSASLGNPAKSIYLNADDVLAFGADAGQPNGIRVQVVPLSSLSAPTPGQSIDPRNLPFTPDATFLDKNGLLYLFSKAHQCIFRWHPILQTWGETIPLIGSASFVAYSPELHRIYTAYPSGLIRKLDLGAVTFAEVPFANTPSAPPLGLSTAGTYLFAVDDSGAWDSHHTFSPAGALVESVEWNEYSTEFIWSSVNQKMYYFRDGVSPNDLLWEQINANGTAYPSEPAGGIGTHLDSPLHTSEGFSHPIRVAPNGSTVVLGSGVIHDGLTLARLATSLANAVQDIAWVGNDLRTIRNVTGAVQFQQWNGSNYAQGLAVQFPGSAHALLSLGGNRLLGVTLSNGMPSFYVMDENFGLIAPTVLDAPGGLSAAIPANNQIKITWTDVTGESSYAVERRTLPGTTWQSVGTTGTSVVTLTDTGMVLGNRYAYRVIAKNGAIVSAPSAEVVVDFSVPAAPQGLTATAAGSSTIALQWLDAATETGYIVEWKTEASSTWSELATLTAGITNYTHNYLNAGATYMYRVRALNALGSSPTSTVASATTDSLPATTPSIYTITAPNFYTVNLTWSNSSYETGYVLERRTNAGTWGVIANPGQNVTTYSDTTVQALTGYFYRIKAVNGLGASGYSTEASVTTPAMTPPAAPLGLVARPINGTSVSVTWNSTTRADGYLLQRQTDNAGNWVDVATLDVNAVSYVDSGRQAGIQYFYRVAAFNAGGMSAFSNVDDAIPLDYAVVLADDFDPALDLMWSSVTGGEATNGGAGFRGSKALWFGGGGVRAAKTLPIDTRMGGFVEFSFRAGNAASDGAQYWDDAESGENVVLEYSVNGTQWIQLKEFITSAPAQKVWQTASVEIPTAAYGEAIQFRWRQLMHGGPALDVWALEDLAIKTMAPPLPAAPAGLIVGANSSERITLFWAPVEGATSYQIELFRDGGWENIGAVSGATQWHSVSGLQADTLYSVRVRSGNFSGISGPSEFALVRTWRMEDDPSATSTISLAAASFSSVETPTGGVAIITVQRNNGGEGSATVTYALANGTAQAGVDFTALSGTLAFEAGETSKTVAVPLLPDTLHEGAETFTVSLTGITGDASLGSTVSATVTIADDDHPGAIAFEVLTSSVKEGGTAQIKIVRTGGSDGAVTVSCQLAGGPAGSSDFEFISTIVEFSSGETEKMVSVETYADDLREGREEFWLQLNTPTGGASLGTIRKHGCTIQDDEPFEVRKANYIGLVHDSAVQADCGWIRLSVTAKGTVSGKLSAHGQQRIFYGKLDATGGFTTFVIPGVTVTGSSATKTITVSLDPNAEEFTFALSDAVLGELTGAGEALLQGTAEVPMPHVGYYTATLAGEPTDETTAEQKGFATLRVGKTGVAAIRGKLPDGSSLAFQSGITTSRRLPMAARLSAKRGHGLHGWLNISAAEGLIGGDLRWKKPAGRGANAGSEIDEILEIDGRPYVREKVRDVLLSSGSSSATVSLRLAGGGLEGSITRLVTVNDRDELTIQPPGQDRMRLSISSGTGLVTGTFRDVEGSRGAIKGILLQSCGVASSTAAGFFSLNGQFGEFELEPNE